MTTSRKKKPAVARDGMITRALHSLVANVPLSGEKASPDPASRAGQIGMRAAVNAAALSGAAALPPGPLGLATIFPDLLGVWRLQQQMVADIAQAYGKRDALTPEAMVTCLFEHAEPSVAKTLGGRSRAKIATRGVAHQTLQLLLEKIAIRVGQRLVRKSLSRWIPIVGALGVGAHAYHDTTKVAQTTIRFLSDGGHHDSARTPRAPRKQRADGAGKSGPARRRSGVAARSRG